MTTGQTLIKESGLTIDKIAEKLSVKVGTVYSYACGRREIPKKKADILRLIIKKLEKI